MTTATITDEPAIYVGTYKKYNEGSIKGAWLNLEDYSDAEEFYEACAELHSDERDPEYMFQDWQCIPDGFISESGIANAEDLWEWLALDEDERKILKLYAAAVGADASLSNAQEAFYGTADSEADFAERIAEDCGEIPENMPTWIVIDWEASWNCSLRHDFVSVYDYESGNFYFFNCNI